MGVLSLIALLGARGCAGKPLNWRLCPIDTQHQTVKITGLEKTMAGDLIYSYTQSIPHNSSRTFGFDKSRYRDGTGSFAIETLLITPFPALFASSRIDFNGFRTVHLLPSSSFLCY